MSSSPDVTIFINAKPFGISPGHHTGTQIRELLDPPARDLFWDIEDAADRAISPDAVITVTDGLRFFTGAPITVFLDAHPYTVAAGAISEHQLRQLPTPPIAGDLDIWHDIPDAEDQRLARNEIIDALGGERFFSAPKHHHPLTIIVNTRTKNVDHRDVPFDKLVKLAFDHPPTGENVLFTITYSNAVAPQHKGSLPAGGILTVKEGTIVNVHHSDKS